MPLTQAINNFTLIDGMGVNVHTATTSAAYASYPASKVLSSLQYIGVHHVRDDWGDEQNNTQRQTIAATLMPAGIRYCFVNNNSVHNQAAIDNMVSSAASYITSNSSVSPSPVFALEGANEQDAGFSFNSSSGVAGNAAFQQALWNSVQANSTLTGAGVKVVNLSLSNPNNFSNYSNVTSYCDFANVHWYPANTTDTGTPWYTYANPWNWLGMIADCANSSYCNKPNSQVIFTETGINTTALSQNGEGGCDQATQAKNLLSSYMDCQRAGNARVYWYELADSSNGQNSSEQAFGIFTSSWTAKTAATALHNFTSVLTAGGIFSGTPGSLNYSVTGLPSTSATIPSGYQLLYQQADGRFDIIAWVEQITWNESTNSVVSPAPSPTSITIQFASPQNVNVYDPMIGTGAQQNYSGITTLTYNIVDHPIIFEVMPQGVKATSNSSLIDSMGVNVHLSWTGTGSPYTSATSILSALEYLGLHHIRDDWTGTSTQRNATCAALSNVNINGGVIKVSEIMNDTTQLNAYITDVANLQSSYNVIGYIEGPNEVDNTPFSYGGNASGAASVLPFQQALWNAVQSNSILTGAGVKVYSVSLANLQNSLASTYGNLAPYCDYGNVHWLWNQNTPYYAYAGWSWPAGFSNINGSGGMAQGNPVVFTLVGVTTTLPYGTSGVDQTVQAKMVLCAYMDGQKTGTTRSYIYELADDTVNATGYGLYNINWTPKTSATALHNFTAVMCQGGMRSTTTGSLIYNVSGLPSGSTIPSSGNMLYQQADGRFDIVLWAEQIMWNNSTEAEQTGLTNYPTTITFPGTVNVNIYDPMIGTTPQATYTGVSSVTYTIVDHPIIFEVVNSVELFSSSMILSYSKGLPKGRAAVNAKTKGGLKGRVSPLSWQNIAALNAKVRSFLSAQGSQKYTGTVQFSGKAHFSTTSKGNSVSLKLLSVFSQTIMRGFGAPGRTVAMKGKAHRNRISSVTNYKCTLPLKGRSFQKLSSRQGLTSYWALVGSAHTFSGSKLSQPYMYYRLVGKAYSNASMWAYGKYKLPMVTSRLRTVSSAGGFFYWLLKTKTNASSAMNLVFQGSTKLSASVGSATRAKSSGKFLLNVSALLASVSNSVSQLARLWRASGVSGGMSQGKSSPTYDAFMGANTLTLTKTQATSNFTASLKSNTRLQTTINSVFRATWLGTASSFVAVTSLGLFQRFARIAASSVYSLKSITNGKFSLPFNASSGFKSVVVPNFLPVWLMKGASIFSLTGKSGADPTANMKCLIRNKSSASGMSAGKTSLKGSSVLTVSAVDSPRAVRFVSGSGSLRAAGQTPPWTNYVMMKAGLLSTSSMSSNTYLYIIDPDYIQYPSSWLEPRNYVIKELDQDYGGPRVNQLTPKDPSEKIIVTFDFSALLAPGEVLTQIVSVSCLSYIGTDAAASGMIAEVPIIQNNCLVLQPVWYGLDGVTYKIKVVVNTSLGQTFASTAKLPVVSQ